MPAGFPLPAGRPSHAMREVMNFQTRTLKNDIHSGKPGRHPPHAPIPQGTRTPALVVRNGPRLSLLPARCRLVGASFPALHEPDPADPRQSLHPGRRALRRKQIRRARSPWPHGAASSCPFHHHQAPRKHGTARHRRPAGKAHGGRRDKLPRRCKARYRAQRTRRGAGIRSGGTHRVCRRFSCRAAPHGAGTGRREGRGGRLLGARAGRSTGADHIGNAQILPERHG